MSRNFSKVLSWKWPTIFPRFFFLKIPWFIQRISLVKSNIAKNISPWDFLRDYIGNSFKDSCKDCYISTCILSCISPTFLKGFLQKYCQNFSHEFFFFGENSQEILLEISPGISANLLQKMQFQDIFTQVLVDTFRKSSRVFF